jgi:hypothetical protein
LSSLSLARPLSPAPPPWRERPSWRRTPWRARARNGGEEGRRGTAARKGGEP